MRRKLSWLVLCGAAITAAVLYRTESVRATPANSGFSAKTLAKGTFGSIDAFNQLSNPNLPAGFEGNVWVSMQRTEGPSDLYVQSNTWAAVDPVTGAIASTGWHTHPGHSLIIITSGTVTEYEDDCTPHVYGPGTALGPTLVDPGRGHVHIIRNESNVPATGVAVQLVPQAAARRIDVPAPDGCSNIL